MLKFELTSFGIKVLCPWLQQYEHVANIIRGDCGEYILYPHNSPKFRAPFFTQKELINITNYMSKL